MRFSSAGLDGQAGRLESERRRDGTGGPAGSSGKQTVNGPAAWYVQQSSMPGMSFLFDVHGKYSTCE